MRHAGGEPAGAVFGHPEQRGRPVTGQSCRRTGQAATGIGRAPARTENALAARAGQQGDGSCVLPSAFAATPCGSLLPKQMRPEPCDAIENQPGGNNESQQPRDDENQNPCGECSDRLQSNSIDLHLAVLSCALARSPARRAGKRSGRPAFRGRRLTIHSQSSCCPVRRPVSNRCTRVLWSNLRDLRQGALSALQAQRLVARRKGDAVAPGSAPCLSRRGGDRCALPAHRPVAGLAQSCRPVDEDHAPAGPDLHQGDVHGLLPRQPDRLVPGTRDSPLRGLRSAGREDFIRWTDVCGRRDAAVAAPDPIRRPGDDGGQGNG